MPRNPTWNLSAGASVLNEHHDELIALFRGGASTAELSRTFGTGATNIQKWLKAHGEYHRKVKCGLDECAVEFDFRPGKLYCCRLHTKRADTRNQAAKPENADKIKARNALNSALRSGALKRPDACERCGDAPSRGRDGRTLLQADHYAGYAPGSWLVVQWLCHDCDREVEMLRKGRDDSRIRAGEKIGKWAVLDESPGTRRSVARLLCRCDCGMETHVLERSLRERKSLGCPTCARKESRSVDETH